MLTPKQYLKKYELRAVIERIHDGVPETFIYIMKIRQFYCKKDNNFREQQVLLWFIRNKLTGHKFINFFQEAGSFLDGMNECINRIEGRKFSLRRQRPAKNLAHKQLTK